MVVLWERVRKKWLCSMASVHLLDPLAEALVRSELAPNVALGSGARSGDGTWRFDVGGDASRMFDLASLTKPMTAVAIALAAEGGLSRTTPLAALCPELADTKSASASLELLLSHRAGLTAHIPIFQPLALGGTVDPGEALRTAANARRDECEGPYPAEGFAPVYSDLGYALAGMALARYTGAADAGEAIDRAIVDRLGVRGTLGTARDLLKHGVDLASTSAPTEVVPWRGGLVVGRVHDENAWALTGLGGSGHAGMFGDVSAVLRFGAAVLDGLGGLGPFAGTFLEWLVRERAGGTLRAGFDGKSAEGSSAGRLFSARAFGHLGFTGTSLWVDPDAHVVAVLLTNRVWPSRERAKDAIREARPRTHDALHAFATNAQTSSPSPFSLNGEGVSWGSPELEDLPPRPSGRGGVGG